MMKVQRIKSELGDMIKFHGILSEVLNLEVAIGPVKGALWVNCGGISRINSMGIKNWLHYFNGLSRTGVKLTFVECSDAIVQQLNMVSNFLCGGSLESFYVPFRCSTCDAQSRELVNVEAIRKREFQVSSHPCESCESGVAEFDDLPDELFRFLQKEGAR